MKANLFAAAGTRNTGTATQIFVVVPPGWRGTPPSGAVVIQSPTMHGWIDVKVRVNGVSDGANVQRFQRALMGTPLSQWGNPYEMRGPSLNAAWDSRTPPRDQVSRLSAAEFLLLFTQLTCANPPGEGDDAIVARMGRLGIVTGASTVSTAAPASHEMLERAWHEAQQRIAATSPDVELRDGWRRDATATEIDAADYLHRASFARGGLSPIPADDSISLTADADADGCSLSSDNRCVLRFEARQLPPVRGFWSLTMYDDRHVRGECDGPLCDRRLRRTLAQRGRLARPASSRPCRAAVGGELAARAAPGTVLHDAAALLARARGHRGTLAPAGRPARQLIDRMSSSTPARQGGSVTSNTAPRPGSLTARTVPPCASTMVRTIGNPMPMPPRLVV